MSYSVPWSQYRETIYHGAEWMHLVELGWRTHTVEGRVAVMIYAPSTYNRRWL